MSRRFRICVAKGGRGCLRPSYGRQKLTLILKKKLPTLRCQKKTYLPKSSKLSITTQITSFHSLFRKFWEICLFLTPHIFAKGLTQLGATKTGSKNFVPPLHIDFLNPECVRIPWVLAPKIFG